MVKRNGRNACVGIVLDITHEPWTQVAFLYREGMRYYEKIRAEAKKFAYLIVELTPESREQSLALTHLEDAVFCANASIATIILSAIRRSTLCMPLALVFYGNVGAM